MLQFNPFLRPSAKELLKNKYFDDVREESKEITSPFKLNLEFDTDAKFDCEKSYTRAELNSILVARVKEI